MDDKIKGILKQRKEEERKYNALAEKCLSYMDKYRDITFGIPVWVESHNRLTFRDEETKATRLLTTHELNEIISKYEALEKYIADVEKNTHMGYDIMRKGD